MAALELHCGLEPGGRVWGGERVDLLDSFDSEMQEWEDQLQEMQKKIEELYNEVKARREASETNVIKNESLDITLLPVSSGYGDQPANGYYHRPSDHPNNIRPAHRCNERGGDPSVRQSFGFHHPSDNCNGSNNYTLNPLANGGHFPGSCHDIERRDATLDILNGYLQQGPQLGNIQRNIGAPNTNPKVHPALHSYQESRKMSPVTNRTSSCLVPDEFEEAENKRNKRANVEEIQGRHISWKDLVSANNLPLKNVAIKPRDAPPIPPRSTYHDSPQQPDRKCLLVDRKSASPSVLRKFGAMLQENEGKTLIEDGLVTTVIPTERLASTPVCQRKFSVGRASPRMPVQKSLVDCDVVMAELESGQEPRAAVIPRHMLLNGESVKGGSAPEQCGVAFNLSPSQSPLKAGCHKKALEAKEQKTGFRGEDLFSDYRMVERILGTGSQYHGKVHAGLGGDTRWGNDNLDQLLEKMEMENSRSQRATFTQQLDTKQVSHESSLAPRSNSFSRPARPANQRRPTRWATPTPSSKIISTSCPASPCMKVKQFPNSYYLHTETIIM